MVVWLKSNMYFETRLISIQWRALDFSTGSFSKKWIKTFGTVKNKWCCKQCMKVQIIDLWKFLKQKIINLLGRVHIYLYWSKIVWWLHQRQWFFFLVQKKYSDYSRSSVMIDLIYSLRSIFNEKGQSSWGQAGKRTWAVETFSRTRLLQ